MKAQVNLGTGTSIGEYIYIVKYILKPVLVNISIKEAGVEQM